MKEIGIKLKERRIQNGVSIAESAEDLNLEEAVLEHMESGNVRAFKDMYVLKELIKDYAKYLGLDVGDIVEEFNDFLFEHTSRISLEELKEVKARIEDNASKRTVVSPYTQIPKPKRDYKGLLKPALIGFLVLVILVLLFFIITKEEKRSVELQRSMEEYYEFTY